MGLREDVAAAVSGHRFEEALPHLGEEVVWDAVGAEPMTGREAVAAAFREAGAALASVRTDFTRFRVLSAGDTVVVDSVAIYTEPDGESTVAACDLYDFESDRLIAIRSYNVEV